MKYNTWSYLRNNKLLHTTLDSLYCLLSQSHCIFFENKQSLLFALNTKHSVNRYLNVTLLSIWLIFDSLYCLILISDTFVWNSNNGHFCSTFHSLSCVTQFVSKSLCNFCQNSLYCSNWELLSSTVRCLNTGHSFWKSGCTDLNIAQVHFFIILD